MADTRRRMSWLGALGLLVGVAGCLAEIPPVGRLLPALPSKWDVLGLGAGPVLGAAGLLVSVLALMLATVSRRVGRGLPLLAAVVCVIAITAPLYASGKLSEWVDRYNTMHQPTPAGGSVAPGKGAPAPARPQGVKPS